MLFDMTRCSRSRMSGGWNVPIESVMARHLDLNVSRYLAMVESPLVLWMFVYMDLASYVQIYVLGGSVFRFLSL